MPFYEYKCEKCGRITELFTSNMDNVVKCEWCGGKANKIISLPTLKFIGRGWTRRPKQMRRRKDLE